jgi:phosphatidylserine decarboxylase
MIHKEGFKILLGSLAILAVLNWALQTWVPIAWVKWIVLLASIVIWILFLQFFRNPKRVHTINQQYIVAPADGKLVVIEEVEEPEYFKDKRIQLSIFMSPLNVHVNRNPIAGEVTYFKYHPGDYLVAWHPKSSTLNERTTTVIKHINGQEVLFRQIAGAVARRICWYVHEGQSVDQCAEMGFIKFGSRIDVFLPLGTEIKVNLDQKTIGGQTVLAAFK